MVEPFRRYKPFVTLTQNGHPSVPALQSVTRRFGNLCNAARKPAWLSHLGVTEAPLSQSVADPLCNAFVENGSHLNGH